MAHSDFCNNCRQAHDCKRIYEQLGKTEGSSVTLKVLVAFLLPIIVFALALGLFGRLLTNSVAPRYETPVAFVLAATVTVGLMLAVSIMLKRYYRTK